MRFVIAVLLAVATDSLRADETHTYIACDTLACGRAETEDQRACLTGLQWPARAFEVSVSPAPPGSGAHAAVLRFPSALETGDPVNDQAAVLWYRPANVDAKTLAPAIVVVHESGSSMPVGKLFAGLFAGQGAHAFMVQLPHYGLRRTGKQRTRGDQFLVSMRQGIADVRRARDAVAALPGIDPARISVQGTSLGGFVASTAAGLDGVFDQVFIMVAGGDLFSMLQSGQREAAELRERLEKAGFTGEKLRELLWTVEPNRLASRLNADRTWLYSAEHDQVVPMANALAFKAAAGLASDHHVRLPGDHVTTIVYVPVILMHVMERVRGTARPTAVPAIGPASN